MTTDLTFRLPGEGHVRLCLQNAVVAGWTGRDRAAVDHHIAELQAIGVPPPSTVPLFYRVSAALFTADPAIELVGETSSGEVEPVLFDDGQALYLALGSDHTDRKLETHSVALSKQICAKPVSGDAWAFAEVAGHLDRIGLQSFIREEAGADWVPYQDGTLAQLRPLAELAAASPFAAGPGRLAAGTALMCGTLGVLSGGVRPARHFAMRMHDPVLGRTIEHAYESRFLPVIA
ncbi:DUF2848 domain-containing protein [Afifella sp. IM 167]|uniref:DUF2848 domain-containing protein n=1 Tax=Afifella sp. IM 167 TaxID=2033586 RepID=UPI001CCB8779|nr:DUF2848 domain-containing protein [Afifella sp. IM 167]MBZ8134341.1 hypothetical protein [Afifella sp. IM 167]